MQKVLKIIITMALITSASLLFYRGENAMGVLLMISLLVVPNADKLTDLIVNKDGLHAKFKISKEKTEENIKENLEEVTTQNFIRFQSIESEILAQQQKKYGGEIKTLIHFMYGPPDKPQFMYTPDGTLQTDSMLYFFEIKYVLKPEFAKNIVERTVTYLKTVYDSLAPLSGKKMIIKFILASQHNIDLNDLKIPNGIEIELIKI